LQRSRGVHESGSSSNGCAAYQPSIIGTDDRHTIPRLEGTDVGGRAWIAPTGTAVLLAYTPEISWERYDEIASRLDVPVCVALSAAALAENQIYADDVADLLLQFSLMPVASCWGGMRRLLRPRSS